MDAFTCREPHPYGATPSGNMFFASESNRLVRRNGLGRIYVVKDELLIDILSYLSGESLARTISTSRALYAYGHHSELWRDLALRLNNEGSGLGIQYCKTWKDTYVKMLGRFTNYHKPLIIPGIHSNLLHRSWACYSCDLNTACPGFNNQDIPRVAATDLTPENFLQVYEEKNVPVVVTGAVKHWPCLAKWSEEYLTNLCGEHKMRATSATAPLSANFTAAEYFQYSKEAKEEAPLYLFERDFAKISPALNADYDVPSFFSSSNLKGTDLFRLFGEDKRPDYRWLICGPARSGSIFHIDPNQTNAWNVCLKGRKKWIFYPPNTNPPGVESSPDGADVAVPISTGEWLLSFWKAHMEERLNPDVSRRPLEVTVEPGEVIFVPHGYWHMVVNLDDCIALTHNYVSTSNLSDCLRFLRDTPDQISGVRDRQSEGSVQPDMMYSEFIRLLENCLGKDVLDVYVGKSLVGKKKVVSLHEHNNRKRKLAHSKPQQKKKEGSLKGSGSIMNKHENLSDCQDGESKKETFSFGFFSPG